MNVKQFFEFILRPTLRHLDPEIPYSLAAERLVAGTILHESSGLTYIDQTTPGPGPAYGIAQIQENSLTDSLVWLNRHPDAAAKVYSLVFRGLPILDQMQGNLYLSVAFCRVHYRRCKFLLPAPDDFEAMARVYKQFFNTSAGAATPQDFLDDGPNRFPTLFA